MGSIAQNCENEKNFSSRMREFFSRYQVGDALKQSNAYKKQGYSVLEKLAAGFNWTKDEIRTFIADFIADLPDEIAQLFALSPACR